ncbi:MAG: BrnT family toxin [Beijerinckiaceae bacterium]
MPEFQWDERKRLSNLKKHKLDFLDAKPLFDGRDVLSTVSSRSNEERFTTTGEIDGHFYTIVWTWRVEIIRLISFRSARDAEKRTYRNRYG